MPHAVTLAEFGDALRRSFGLIAARPFKWLLVTVVFLVGVESLMFIPYVGFVTKLAAAGLFGAQFMRMFADVDAGGSPRFKVFPRSLALPWSAQWLLVAAGMAPFMVGIAYLALVGGGWAGTEYFFGHLSKETAPTVGAFFVFKIVMSVVGMILVFVPPVVVLGGMSGLTALRAAGRAASLNWRLLAFFLVVNAAFEGLTAGLSHLPPVVVVLASVVALVLYLLWALAMTYTCATRVFGSDSTSPTSPLVDLREADLR